MIAVAFDPRVAAPPPAGRLGAREPELAPYVAPLLARLLAGEPLDRDQRAVIVGEVLRLWAAEATPR